MLCGDGRADECIFFAARQKHNRTERKAYRSTKRFLFQQHSQFNPTGLIHGTWFVQMNMRSL